MRQHIKLLFGWLALLVALFLLIKIFPVAAESSTPKKLFILARGACAPWDGEELEIRFFHSEVACENTEEGNFWVGIWRVPIPIGERLSLDEKGASQEHRSATEFTGFASRRVKNEVLPIESAKKASIVITEKTKTKLSGRIQVEFSDYQADAEFSGVLCPGMALCG